MENTPTKRIQEVLIRLFTEFVRICDKYQLRYYPIDGTLLGAIRHQGFIPWDDDLDIAMPRLDYEKFCIIVERELPNNMYWVSYEESLKGNYFGEIAHLFCNDLKLETNYFEGTVKTDVWMDVMIMYGMPSSKLLQKLHYKHVYLYRGLARMGHIQNIGNRHYTMLERLFIYIAQVIDLSEVINTEKLLLRSIKILKKYELDQSSYLIILPSEYGLREVVPKVYYFDVYEGVFENIKINIPNGSKTILRNLYGNYMQLPKMIDRKSKHKVAIVDEV